METARLGGTRCRVDFTKVEVDARTMEEEVLAGLRAVPKTISPKYLYDAEGSRLFDRICELPEYYLTRTETSILKEHGHAILDRIGPDLCIIEPGAGACGKGRLLLETDRASAFVPVDISAEYLKDAALGVADSFPDVSVHAVAMDFLAGLDSLKPLLPRAATRLIFYAGSSIGNFDPPDARRLLRQFHDLLEEGDALLIGYDLQKDHALLHRAYDDPDGITASFNLNLLARLNRELGADFDLGGFRHVARYNEAECRMEMHLESLAGQKVRIGTESVLFGPSEHMHTESSYKYTVEGFDALAARAGFRRLDVWTDPASYFAVGLYRKDAAFGHPAPLMDAG
jgi:dimethylhistidine N-methyltransferase